jgi:hypothetical protein
VTDGLTYMFVMNPSLSAVTKNASLERLVSL